MADIIQKQIIKTITPSQVAGGVEFNKVILHKYDSNGALIGGLGHYVEVESDEATIDEEPNEVVWKTIHDGIYFSSLQSPFTTFEPKLTDEEILQLGGEV